MNRKLLDILVCPFDKETQLELLEFRNISADAVDEKQASNKPLPRNDMALEGDKSMEVNDTSVESIGSNNKTFEIEEGILTCKDCLRFYPIIDEIPIILPDDLRDRKKDIEFLLKWKLAIPQHLLINLKPWTI